MKVRGLFKIRRISFIVYLALHTCVAVIIALCLYAPCDKEEREIWVQALGRTKGERGNEAPGMCHTRLNGLNICPLDHPRVLVC